MIVARVRRTIEGRGLLESGMRVIAACSGGPDSAAMLVALSRLAEPLGFELGAAVTVHHGLRADADHDVAAARAQAAAARVPFEVVRLQLSGSASLQAVAREARYAALEDARRRHGAQRVAVGHTRDDQAETVLMRVLRGAGLSGLAAIEPLREDGVMRPLIDCVRADVHAFARRHGPQVACDPSNHDARFERVRVRRTVLPALLHEDPVIVEHLAALADDARQALPVLQEHARRALDRSRQGSDNIDVCLLVPEVSPVRRWALRLWVKERTNADLGRSHLLQLEHALLHGGEVWLPGGRVVRRCGGLLALE